MYDVQQKHIKVVCAVYKNNAAVIKVENEVSSWFCIKSGVKQGCVLSPSTWIILMDFILKSIGMAMGEHGIKWGRKTPLYGGRVTKQIHKKKKSNDS